MSAILSLYFLSLFLIFFSFSFSLLFSVFLLSCCDFFLKITITRMSPLYNACHDWFLQFYSLTTFVWPGCPCRPSLVCQSLSQHHLSVPTVPLPITRQRGLFYSFVYRGTLAYYGVGAFSFHPSWHAPSDSNSSLLLLDGMSSQQDISLKRA